MTNFGEPRQPPSDGMRLGLLVGIVLASAIAIFCLLVVIMAGSTWWKSREFPLLAIALLAAGGAGLMSWLTFVMLAARSPSGPKPAYCQNCGAVRPTIKVSLNRHIGAIILMFHKSLSGYLCKECIQKTFWEFMPITVLFGWWGLLSVFITPIVIINNIIVYVRSFFMPNAG